MDYYGPPPGEKPNTGIDLQGWLILGATAIFCFAWVTFTQGKKPPPTPTPSPSASASATPAGPAPVESASTAAPESAVAVKPDPVESTYAFSTPAHTIKLSNRGASVRDLTFTQIRESTFAPVQTAEQDKREAQLFHALAPQLPDSDGLFSFSVEPEAYPDHGKRVWQHAPLDGGGHRFTLSLPDDWELQKDYLPPSAAEGEAKDVYHFRLVVRVVNKQPIERSFRYWLNGTAGIVNQETGRESYGVEAFVGKREQDGDVLAEIKSVIGVAMFGGAFDDDEPTSPQIDIGRSQEQSVAYYGLVTKYFASAIVPLEGASVERAQAWYLLGKVGRLATSAEEKQENGPKRQAVTRGLLSAKVGAQGSVEHPFMIYVGPRQSDAVFEQPAYAKHGLEEIIYYGWSFFAPVARVLSAILHAFHSVIGNWGLAILLLTVLVRLCILPLSLMQQKSAIGMQKLTPELNALREKLSDKDGQMTREAQLEFSQAQMELFRKHGVNPIGCLGPLFLQMPIFIALYNVCRTESGLRGAEFFGWISDLSTPDVLFRMPITIPFLETNAFSLLPLFLVGLYILQQRLQPPPADEKAAEQQKIMKFIFPVFGLLFYTMPSGLLVYWVASTLWGICEQKFVKNKLFPPDASKPDAAKADAGKGAALAMPGLDNVGKALEPAATPAAESAKDDQGGGKKNKGKKGKRKKKRK